tara:strand:+ start:109 stop:267 length:159 start_codon:yes stop_codon:yes gene_type:complete
MIWLNLIKLLAGFVLAMLGIILALHSDHTVPGLLVSTAGVLAVLTSLPAERT